MATTYDVRIWANDIYKGKRATSYIVRWRVGDRRFKERYRTAALADSFRSELVTAARKGEAFDVDTGRPVSMGRTSREMSWYDFACAYMDMKWPAAAATYRRPISEALTAITPALFDTDQGVPEGVVLRRALHTWAFNSLRRADPSCPSDVRDALRWVQLHTRPVARLAEPKVLRQVLDVIARRIDGTPAGGNRRSEVTFDRSLRWPSANANR